MTLAKQARTAFALIDKRLGEAGAVAALAEGYVAANRPHDAIRLVTEELPRFRGVADALDENRLLNALAAARAAVATPR